MIVVKDWLGVALGMIRIRFEMILSFSFRSRGIVKFSGFCQLQIISLTMIFILFLILSIIVSVFTIASLFLVHQLLLYLFYFQ